MSDDVEQPTVLRAPALPVPPVVASPDQLLECADSLAAGEGPIAVDAERAGGFRYTQRAYLLQFHRRGAGTWLVDP
ncbi:MAG: ribonuclease, partial [Actinomycetota bacterium]|nr:ribonuclease [Actinomycetota bacterium]